MLTVGVLGPLEVRRDGRPLSVPSGRTTEVLVRLALDAGQRVSAERLIDDLWGRPPPARAEHPAVEVSQLRRAPASRPWSAAGTGATP
jgi:DNA-binding SARP family transcriptional activator